jgi:hypothetical protein
MSRLAWHSIPQPELALLLKQAKLDASRAVGSSTVYQLTIGNREMLAVSLPDGQAVIIETQAPPKVKRRRVDPPAAA